MNLINATAYQSGLTVMNKPDGEEVLVVVIKATFNLPQSNQQPDLSTEQVPLFEADIFTGDSANSSVLYESDFAIYKQYCDVVLNGSAYSPGAKPISSLQVGMKVASLQKTFKVIGDRVWQKQGNQVTPSEPAEFVKIPINYEYAYGGIDETKRDPEHLAAFNKNPVGKGFYQYNDVELLHNCPLPNTEIIGIPLTNPVQQSEPQSFSSIGRSWSPRIDYAGTYDEHWKTSRFPFMPEDFDYRYFQCAPVDQQIPYPQGGEEVVLVNITKDGRRQFLLPTVAINVHCRLKQSNSFVVQPVIDTIVIEPDDERFTMALRAAMPLKKSILEVSEVYIAEAKSEVTSNQRAS